jgi:hypothetical protein
MEFAITVPDNFDGSDDSWLPDGARSFCFLERKMDLADWSPT